MLVQRWPRNAVTSSQPFNEILTGKGELICWVVNCYDCGIPIHVLMKTKAKYIKDDAGEVIGWCVPCRDCGIFVNFYKPSKESTFVPNATARCGRCYEAHCVVRLRGLRDDTGRT